MMDGTSSPPPLSPPRPAPMQQKQGKAAPRSEASDDVVHVETDGEGFSSADDESITAHSPLKHNGRHHAPHRHAHHVNGGQHRQLRQRSRQSTEDDEEVTVDLHTFMARPGGSQPSSPAGARLAGRVTKPLYIEIKNKASEPPAPPEQPAPPPSDDGARSSCCSRVARACSRCFHYLLGSSAVHYHRGPGGTCYPPEAAAPERRAGNATVELV
eukprot:TRINITY_DN13520_c0_g1_i1.p2 TRINITY_DN13520_c0_g1~~TRINITY_DN13520_c0_g1_i1.p2  ORF type:complete len:213 (-),score=47.97 TRINITY_DN13520_c0_g1_i1:1162-1800(-)